MAELGRNRAGLRGAIARAAVVVLTVVVSALTSPVAVAEEASVPLAIQAQLLAKVAGYDRNLPARAQGTVRVLLVTRKDDTASARAAAQVAATLRDVPTIAGMPHVEESLVFTSGPALAAECRARRASVVYLMPGLGSEVGAVGAALAGADVLSATASSGVRGSVLGFDLVSGRPVLVVDLGQARRQNVALKPEVLKLARVVE